MQSGGVARGRGARGASEEMQGDGLSGMEGHGPFPPPGEVAELRLWRAENEETAGGGCSRGTLWYWEAPAPLSDLHLVFHDLVLTA